METTTEQQQQQDTSHRRRAGIVAVGAALGLTLAGLGVAAAQTDGSTPTPTTPPAQSTPAPDGGGDREARPGKAFGGRHGHGRGMGMGIHGEFVTPAPGGGYQTLATQRGEVVEVSATSVKVKSEDGFERAYAVDDSTMVNAGNEGIADVKVGDQVHVMAVVADGKATAKNIHDVTQGKALREGWAPPRPARPAESGSGTSS